MITINVSLHSNNRSHGFWKLNTSLLEDTEYVALIKSVLQQTKDEYTKDEKIDRNLLWEMVKMKIREHCMLFGTFKKRKMAEEQEEVERSISALEKHIIDGHADDSEKERIWTKLQATKRELEKIIEHQTKAAILRSKIRWYNEGEKNAKCFLNLEKPHCRRNTISQLKVNDNDFIYTDIEILNECESFYKNLYSPRIECGDHLSHVFPLQESPKALNDVEQATCEGPQKKEECLKALQDMDSDKTPGTDGLPSEFYKVFWDELADILIDALNYSHENGKLLISQRRGIIKLIPKKDAELNLVKNWRPLRLLSCDYKIATKALANRIKPFVQNSSPTIKLDLLKTDSLERIFG